MRPQAVNIIGAGLAGSLLAVALARRGFAVSVYERRPDPRTTPPDSGRSINLALAERGIEALRRFELMADVEPLLISMSARIVHQPGTASARLPYGLRPSEVIHSVSRSALNRVLIEAAADHGAALHFNHACVDIDVGADSLRLRDTAAGSEHTIMLTPTIAADGSGSASRGLLARAGLTTVTDDRLDHDYKELAVPPLDGKFALEPHALHIWPRGGFMLIALPNLDASFTATLFLNREGATSFEGLATLDAVREFYEQHFPDVLRLAPQMPAEFLRHPRGQLNTVHASHWHHGGQVLLLGDAAHAIVPFHGQGMNAAFEDCAVFDGLLDGCDDWAALFAEFERLRRPNAEAIAQMALENYVEMRDTVLDPKFRRFKTISLELEERFPNRFVPRYSMVMFHAEIPYREALRRGAVQMTVLEELDGRRTASGDIDAGLAERLVNERLSVLP